jgi:hypothetical protein
VHVHSAGAWERLLHTIPTTAADVPYGTPAMARELQRLYRETALPSVRVAAMAGHPEGLIAFGQTIEEATRHVVEWCGPAQSSPANGGER